MSNVRIQRYSVKYGGIISLLHEKVHGGVAKSGKTIRKDLCLLGSQEF